MIISRPANNASLGPGDRLQSKASNCCGTDQMCHRLNSGIFCSERPSHQCAMLATEHQRAAQADLNDKRNDADTELIDVLGFVSPHQLLLCA